MADWFQGLHPLIQASVRVVLFFVPMFMMIPVMIWYERRLLSWMQDRIGPNRVGNITFSKTSKLVPQILRGRKIKLFGLLQPMADGAKSFFKEDFMPAKVDKFLFILAPAVFLFPAFALGATLPWGPYTLLTPISDANIGVLYVLAISSLGVYGVVLAGYSSENKYSLLGGLRASAQLISYELAMGMAIAAIAMATGSLRLTDIVSAQEGRLWGIVPGLANWNVLTPYGFIAFIVFLICMVAETNRAPFDLPECENELIAGYNTEYSTKKWVLFMMGEYVNMIVYSMLLATIFFGGWHLLPFQFDQLAREHPQISTFYELLAKLNGSSILGPVWFVAKVAVMLTCYIWIRATLPRLRYDQLMALGWKTLLPVATVNVILVALWIVATKVYSPVLGWAAFLCFGVLIVMIYRALKSVIAPKTSSLASRTLRLDMSPANVSKPEPEPELVEVAN